MGQVIHLLETFLCQMRCLQPLLRTNIIASERLNSGGVFHRTKFLKVSDVQFFNFVYRLCLWCQTCEFFYLVLDPEDFLLIFLKSLFCVFYTEVYGPLRINFYIQCEVYKGQSSVVLGFFFLLRDIQPLIFIY